MELLLENFLPKYPEIGTEIETELPPSLRPYEKNFYEALNDKREFYDLALRRNEGRPEFRGDLYRHQKIIARFLSSYTPYNSLLLFHYMGTGKTCSAFGTTEKIRSEDDSRKNEGLPPVFKGVIVLARSDPLIENLINELAFKCTDGRYIPENFETLTEQEKKARVKKKIKDYYEFKTFYGVAKEIQNLSDAEIKSRYSNRVIIIDEVHNIQETEDKTKKLSAEKKKKRGEKTYKQIHRLLHAAEGGKILLLSGTPMTDKASEISMVMNLILPEDRQLPVDAEFERKFMERREIRGGPAEYLMVREDKQEKLKEYFKGLVSYLSTISDLPREYIGEYVINGIPTFTLDADIMSSFQSKYYMEAHRKENSDKGERSKAFHYGEIQASLFVFPGGQYGKDGYATIVRKTKATRKVDGETVEFERTTFDFSSVKSFLRKDGDSTEAKLKALSVLSSKYAKVVAQILEADDRSVFVYSNSVTGSGAVVFGLILQEFGFAPARGGEKTPGLRYGIITHETTSAAQIRHILQRFNQPDNFQGKFIKVIIGSRVIGEGFSLLNVQEIHILTPWWNYSEISQAIFRGIREGSHQTLFDRGIQPRVKIYQHASVPQVKLKGVEERKPKYDRSIDIQMYKISAEKDISIKSVERLMKEAAFDCELTRGVNYSSKDPDFSRECDYDVCRYTCDGLEDYRREPDLSTYQLYYSEGTVGSLERSIKGLFKTHFSLSASEMDRELTENFTNFELLTSLRNLINLNTSLKNKYGFSSYIKENDDQYFLVNSLTAISEKFSEYYTRKPYIRDPIEFTTLLGRLEGKFLPKIIDALPGLVDSDKEFLDLLNRLPLTVKSLLLEASVSARENGTTKNRKFREKILSIFKHYIQKVDGVWVSSILFEDFKILRCYRKNVWADCKESVEEKWLEAKQELKIGFENNPYGYYGIYDPVKKKFWIREVKEETQVESDDRRKKTTGTDCNSWHRDKLLRMIEDIKLEYPEDFCRGLSKEEVYNKAQANTWARQTVDESMSRDTLCRILYYASYQKKELCPILKKWFEERGLLEVGKKDEKK